MVSRGPTILGSPCSGKWLNIQQLVKVKHNIMSTGSLSPGDLLPDVTLWNLDGGHVKLRESGIQVASKSCNPHLRGLNIPTFEVILASSYS